MVQHNLFSRVLTISKTRTVGIKNALSYEFLPVTSLKFHPTGELRKSKRANVTFCSIWNHSHNLKNVKNTHGGVLLLVKLQAEACNFTKSNTPP